MKRCIFIVAILVFCLLLPGCNNVTVESIPDLKFEIAELQKKKELLILNQVADTPNTRRYNELELELYQLEESESKIKNARNQIEKEYKDIMKQLNELDMQTGSGHFPYAKEYETIAKAFHRDAQFCAVGNRVFIFVPLNSYSTSLKVQEFLETEKVYLSIQEEYPHLKDKTFYVKYMSKRPEFQIDYKITGSIMFHEAFPRIDRVTLTNESKSLSEYEIIKR